MDAFCGIVILGIVLYAGIKIAIKANEKQNDKERSIESQIQWVNSNVNELNNELSSFFNNSFCLYRDELPRLNEIISHMESNNESLVKLRASEDRSAVIAQCKNTVKKFEAYGKTVDKLPTCFMMNSDTYGKVNEEFMSSVRSLSRSTVESIINDYENRINSNSFDSVLNIDLNSLIKCVWFCFG